MKKLTIEFEKYEEMHEYLSLIARYKDLKITEDHNDRLESIKESIAAFLRELGAPKLMIETYANLLDSLRIQL